MWAGWCAVLTCGAVSSPAPDQGSPPTHTPISIHPANPRYFEFRGKARRGPYNNVIFPHPILVYNYM
jgi:hypothetical protein